MTVSTRDRALKSSAWFLYTLIVLEILFMISPFAAYYYSLYATPLNALQQSRATAWLTMYVLPHFAYSDSWLANSLLLVSWPLILAGVVLFLVGFCQIYWAKLRGRGAVEAGLYRFVRHPQYVALAVLGLGCSLYWSRFVVIITFVSMLCLYGFLARTEERICLQRFGDPYRDYLDRTGRFLPKRWEAPCHVLARHLPSGRWARSAVMALLFLCALGAAVGVGALLRAHVIDSLHTDDRESHVVVYLAPVRDATKAQVGRLLAQARLPGEVAYVAPASWSVPELGLRPRPDAARAEPARGHFAELFHPTTHGNPLSADRARWSVVTAEATHVDGGRDGESRLARALNLRLVGFAEIDVAADTVTEQRVAGESEWAGVPVPTF